MSTQKILQILLIATEEEDMVCQLNMNQVGRTGGIDVKAEDIIDVIDGYKGGGYGLSTQHEQGGYTLVRTGLLPKWLDQRTSPVTLSASQRITSKPIRICFITQSLQVFAYNRYFSSVSTENDNSSSFLTTSALKCTSESALE